MKVIIPKGTKVKTMHPSRREYVTKRKLTVNIVDTKVYDDVTWAGTGGYWNRVNVKDIIDVNPDLRRIMVVKDDLELFERSTKR